MLKIILITLFIRYINDALHSLECMEHFNKREYVLKFDTLHASDDTKAPTKKPPCGGSSSYPFLPTLRRDTMNELEYFFGVRVF
jgi:hypothetical protein